MTTPTCLKPNDVLQRTSGTRYRLEFDATHATLIQAGKCYITRNGHKPQPEEQPVSLTLTTLTLLNGEDTAHLSDDSLFARIAAAENQIANLEKIENKPKKLVAKIEAMRDDIAALVDLIDTRNNGE